MICVNAERLEQEIKEMGQIGLSAKTGGRTRLALSDADKAARDLFCRWLRDSQLEVRVDPLGNIFGIREGTDRSAQPAVMIGSHLDTVKDAGMFDGAVGVLGGLEVLRTLNDNGIKTKRSIVVADFTNEEGARFEFDMMGSSFYSGAKTAEELYSVTDDYGATVGGELERIGYRGNDSVSAGHYIELHVEQGPVLDAERVQIGVVEGIQGLAWWRGEFIGEANHAGSTPMRLRHDALLGAAELALEVEKLAGVIGNSSVGTMGRIKPQPDVINIVPGKCSFTIDFRQYKPELLVKAKEEITRAVEAIAAKRGLACRFEKLTDVDPVFFDKVMVEIVEESAKKLGLSKRRLYSGAGHDAQFLARRCPAAMIFTPSSGGRSHCREEWTDFEDITNGCDVLLHSVMKLAIIDC